MFASKHVMTYTLSPKNIGVTHVVRCTQALLSNFQCKTCHFRGSLNFQTSILPNHQHNSRRSDLPNNHKIVDLKKKMSFWQNLFPSPPPQKNGQKDRASRSFFLLDPPVWILRAKSQKVGSAENFATPQGVAPFEQCWTSQRDTLGITQCQTS